MHPDRRQFAAGLAALAAEAPTVKLATNAYPWGTFYRRAKKDFNADPDKGLAAVKAAGLDGYEPIVTGVAQLKTLGPLLVKHGLEMSSIYVNSKLHEKDADASLREVAAIAAEAKRLGASVVVTNPSPIRWGGTEDKTDAQLTLQARNLDALGAALRKLGLTLAYHNHDSELRQAAREFHHMLTATDPANVKFCLDAHWVFRGAGDSQVALFDALTHYADRVVELHLRQSKGGVWTEAFGPGDLDYGRLWKALRARKLTPLLVLEQAVEAKTPDTMDAVEAHRKGAAYARGLFKG